MLSSVRQSVCPSVCVTLFIVDVGGRKLYHCVPRTVLPIHFFRHFAVGCIVQPPDTAKNRTAEISASGIAMDRVVM